MGLKEDFHRTKQYWGMVWKRAKKNAWGKMEMRGILLVLLLLLIVASVIFLISVFSIQPLSWDGFVKELTGDLIIQLFYVVCFFIIFIIVALFNLVFLPPKIYEEQNERIGVLSPSMLNIDIHYGGTKSIEQNSIKREYLILRVINNNQQFMIEELDAELKTIIHYEISTYGELKTEPFIPGFDLTWENGKKITSIRPTKETFVYLCEYDNDTNGARFTVDGFPIPICANESIFQFSIFHYGKMEGEKEFRKKKYPITIYVFPEKSRLSSGNDALLKYDDIPQALTEILNIAQSGDFY